MGAEVDALREEAAATKAGAGDHLSFADMFRGSLRWPMTIATMLMLAQQLSGKLLGLDIGRAHSKYVHVGSPQCTCTYPQVEGGGGGGGWGERVFVIGCHCIECAMHLMVMPRDRWEKPAMP